MIRLTLRTLLAYLDDTLSPADAKVIGQKLAESESARELADRIRKVTRKRSLSTPATGPDGGSTDPNTVAAYLSDALGPEVLADFEKVSLESDVQLAELAACHQILTMLLSEQVRVPPTAYRRMYAVVKGKESVPNRPLGRTALPVGGVSPNAPTADEADEADAAYLLGLPAYSRAEPGGRKALRWGAVAALAAGFAVAAWLAWPKERVPAGEPVARTTTTDKAPSTPTVPATPPATPATVPTEKKDEPKPVDPMVPPTSTPPMPVDPMPPMPKEDIAAKQPPVNNRNPVGVSETADEQVVVAKKADADGWARVAKGAEVFASDRLVCLPGFKAKVKFASGLVAELWGNVPPDLQEIPLAETALTPHIPYDGYDADLTLHVGRVYLSGGGKGAVVRVRFSDGKFAAKDVSWDVTLPDKGSEAVVEVRHRLTPGAAADPPQTRAVLHVLKGTASLPIKRKATTVQAGEVVEFDSVKGMATAPEKVGKGVGYFSREQVFADEAKFKVMRDALRVFAERVSGEKAATVAAAVPEMRELTRKDAEAALKAASPDKEVSGEQAEAVRRAAARFWVLAAAALGDVSGLADLLNSDTRPDLRPAAVDALRGLLASSPDRVDALRDIARKRWGLSDAEADAFLNTLSGVNEQRLRDADTLTKLVAQLNAGEVAVREAALFTLLTQVDPPTKDRPGIVFDVGGPQAQRDAAVKAWEKRVAELVKEPK